MCLTLEERDARFVMWDLRSAIRDDEPDPNKGAPRPSEIEQKRPQWNINQIPRGKHFTPMEYEHRIHSIGQAGQA